MCRIPDRLLPLDSKVDIHRRCSASNCVVSPERQCRLDLTTPHIEPIGGVDASNCHCDVSALIFLRENQIKKKMGRAQPQAIPQTIEMAGINVVIILGMACGPPEVALISNCAFMLRNPQYRTCLTTRPHCSMANTFSEFKEGMDKC